MSTSSKTTIVRLPSNIVTEIEAVRADTTLESFVQEAVQAHLAVLRQQQTGQQLAKDYDELALMYPDLMADLADEVWLPLENEALLQTATDTGR